MDRRKASHRRHVRRRRDRLARKRRRVSRDQAHTSARSGNCTTVCRRRCPSASDRSSIDGAGRKARALARRQHGPRRLLQHRGGREPRVVVLRGRKRAAHRHQARGLERRCGTVAIHSTWHARHNRKGQRRDWGRRLPRFGNASRSCGHIRKRDDSHIAHGREQCPRFDCRHPCRPADPNGGKAPSAAVVTLLVTPEDAERIALAQSEGQIMLVLRNPLDNEPTATAGVRTAALFGPAAEEAPPFCRRRSGVKRQSLCRRSARRI